MNIDLVSFGLGCLFGFLGFLLVYWFNKRLTHREMEGVFSTLSMEALARNREEFFSLAQQKLETASQGGERSLEEKKKLIDQTLTNMKSGLENVESVIKTFAKDQEGKFAHLSANLETMNRETNKLHVTTEHLRSALANTKLRGQWGERMAEDVLRLAGFIEGINYAKQKTMGSVRPDFTFFLPQDLKINMDVKFPLDNYWRFIEATSETDKESYKNQFLKDARQRIKEVTTRDYINPEANTVDYVIVFIPNEQVYGFIHEWDGHILDEALKNKVILSSPLTLYAILAVIRQAVDNFKLEHTAGKMITVLRSFRHQWKNFIDSLEKLGRGLEGVQKDYQTIMTTRKAQLEKQLNKIDELEVHQPQLKVDEQDGDVIECVDED